MGPDLGVSVTIGLLATFLILGLMAYEWLGVRLGGVLVLPLLAAYTLFEPVVLAVFGIAAASSFAAGEWIHERTLLYGRRIFVVYLLVGIAASFVVASLLGLSRGFFVALLPGLFAFNLHRETTRLRSALIFLGLLGLFLVLGVAAFLSVGIRTPMAGFPGTLWPLGAILPGSSFIVAAILEVGARE